MLIWSGRRVGVTWTPMPCLLTGTALRMLGERPVPVRSRANKYGAVSSTRKATAAHPGDRDGVDSAVQRPVAAGRIRDLDLDYHDDAWLCAKAANTEGDWARTRAYVARRAAERKTCPGIRRCLKRYIARKIYRRQSRSMTSPVRSRRT
jgi:hypothetical protein